MPFSINFMNVFDSLLRNEGHTWLSESSCKGQYNEWLYSILASAFILIVTRIYTVDISTYLVLFNITCPFERMETLTSASVVAT
jgi:hypothetical protein